MKAIIIEDEILTAEDLCTILNKLPEPIHVVKTLSSVKAAVAYLQNETHPDLIFCDIHLGDGHSFDIFKQVTTDVPVIFCTAYNEYALEAFNNNGVGYVLKPFTKKSIGDVVDKFNGLKNNLAKTSLDFNRLMSAIEKKQTSNTTASILISWKEKILPVRITDIALFSVEFKATRLFTNDNQSYLVQHNLDELENICGQHFYRANRQYLVSKNAIEEVLQYTARKLFVKPRIAGEFDITIAKAKVPEFLNWLKS